MFELANHQALGLLQLANVNRSIHMLWARGDSYDELHSNNKSPLAESLWSPYKSPSISFKFILSSVYHRIPQKRVPREIERFSYMDFKGKIDMKNPDVTLVCMEECVFDRVQRLQLCLGGTQLFLDPESMIVDIEPEDQSRSRSDGDGDFRHVLFGRLVSSFMTLGSFLIAKLSSR